MIFGQIESFVNNHLDSKYQEKYNKLIEDYPIIPFIRIARNNEDDNDYPWTMWFNHDERAKLYYQNDLFRLICDCHIRMLKIEQQLLKQDEEQKSAQQIFALCNEVTNIFGKIDLLNCLQHLRVGDATDEKKHHTVPIAATERRAPEAFRIGLGEAANAQGATPMQTTVWSPLTERAPLTLREDLKRVNGLMRRDVLYNSNLSKRMKMSNPQPERVLAIV